MLYCRRKCCSPQAYLNCVLIGCYACRLFIAKQYQELKLPRESRSAHFPVDVACGRRADSVITQKGMDRTSQGDREGAGR